MRRLVTIGAALAVFVGMCGCAQTPESVIEPKAGSSASPSSAPRPASTLTPPVLPKQAESNDATGAANFVLYWVKATDYSTWTGDTDVLREISDESCAGCSDYIDLIDRTYASGGLFRGGARSISSCSHQVEGPSHYFICKVSAARSIFKVDDQHNLQEASPSNSRVEYAVIRRADSWKMAQIGLAN